MDSFYTGAHTAGDHIHTGITTYNTEEQRQKYRLETDSNRASPRDGLETASNN